MCRAKSAETYDTPISLAERIRLQSILPTCRMIKTGAVLETQEMLLVFSQDGKLFPGGNQYSRFLKILKGVLDDEKMQKKTGRIRVTNQ
ncbi:hypothetical protein PHMEG_00037348 [Phytophthora megakarya]|uniref:Uncharacterized protein n=1 Tax=Phytophthora megakarya TaxID=4795 RepID=A0A225UMD6_9STRA|nr:hypothetical protein PHMEG_00037348 [Phytophthora megakarya]